MSINTFFRTIGLALLLAVNLPAQTVRVIFVSGHAELQRPDEAAAHAVVKGESVIIGTRISTGADGRVVLTPMPGVKSMIAPNTIIVLESASDSQTSPTEVKHQAVIDLKVGAVVTDLQKQPGATFDYSIRTPRGLAGARGTTFTVGINPAGIQTIVVAHGTISLTLEDGRTISLTIGQVSITKTNGDTQHGGKSSDLSPQDQKFAENWMKTTLETLADAVEQGVELQGDALANALATAESLGIKIPDELKQRVQNLIDHPPVKQLTDPNPTNPPPQPPPPNVLDPITDVLPPDLTADQQAVFRSLSPAAQSVILQLADHGITVAVLTPDTDTGLPLTNADIVRNLTALITLKTTDPTAYALFLELAGANSSQPASIHRSVNGGTLLPFLDNAPSPTEWSAAAFSRAAAMWNSTGEGSLTSSQKRDLVVLGAGQIVMDRSASYLAALLDNLPPPDFDNMQSAGWGKFLDGIANNPTDKSLTAALSIISTYDNPDLLAAIKDFKITPDEILQGQSMERPVDELLLALGTLGKDNLTTLHQMSASGDILSFYFDPNQYISPEDLTSRFSTSLAYFKTLTADQQKAIRELGVGTMLLVYTPDQIIGYVGDQTFTAGQRVQEIVSFYTSLTSADKEALRDMGVFQDPSSIYYFSNGAFNSSLLTGAITAYKSPSLSDRTKTYISSETNKYSFFQLYLASIPRVINSLIVNTEGPPPALIRPLALINTLLTGLSADEYSALLDIDGGKAIFEVGHLGDSVEDTTVTTALTNLKTFLDFYNTDLGNSQKSTLRELGIVGDDSVAFLGSDPADHTGLGRLLTAYSELPGSLRASTERLNEADPLGNTIHDIHFGNSYEIKDRSYFFPYAETQTTLVNVSFEAAGDLYVGATKYLVIDSALDNYVTFTVADQGNLALRASNLIDLTSTSFSAGIRTITMEAATINLTNIDFPGGAGVYLNSKLGGTADGSTGSGAYPHFGSSAYGRVNFIGGVSSGGYPITNTSEYDAHGTNIHIGTLITPATPITNPPPFIPPPNAL